MKGTLKTQECGFGFFFVLFCFGFFFLSVCAVRKEWEETEQGGKSKLEAWKTVTLHSGSCNILTTKWNKRGGEMQGERNKGRGEWALRGINEREGDLDAEKMEHDCACMLYRSHTQSSRGPLFFLLWTHRQWRWGESRTQSSWLDYK